MEGSVPAVELHRIAYNALQYSGKDTAVQGTTMWYRWEDELAVVAFDDYFALNDAVRGIPDWDEEEKPSLMTLGQLQNLEKALRDMEGDYTLGDLPFVDPEETLGPAMTSEAGKTLQAVTDKIFGLDSGYLSGDSLAVFALNPDRLRRLSLLKPKGYPLDFQTAYDVDRDENVILFRYGPNCRGAIAPLDREILKEKFKEGELWT